MDDDEQRHQTTIFWCQPCYYHGQKTQILELKLAAVTFVAGRRNALVGHGSENTVEPNHTGGDFQMQQALERGVPQKLRVSYLWTYLEMEMRCPSMMPDCLR